MSRAASGYPMEEFNKWSRRPSIDSEGCPRGPPSAFRRELNERTFQVVPGQRQSKNFRTVSPRTHRHPSNKTRRRWAERLSGDAASGPLEIPHQSAHNFDSLRHLVANFEEWSSKGISGVKALGAYDDQARHRRCAVYLHVHVCHRNRPRCRTRAGLTRRGNDRQVDKATPFCRGCILAKTCSGSAQEGWRTNQLTL